MRTSATCPVHASSAVDAAVIRSVIAVIVVFSSDHRAVGSSTSGSVDAIGTNNSMGLTTDSKTADQYHNRKRKASHRELRLQPSRIRRLLPSTVTWVRENKRGLRAPSIEVSGHRDRGGD